MSDLPTNVSQSFLWKVLSQQSDLQRALEALRLNAEAIGAKISEVIPDFTDHSITHMDALWAIADEIFTSEEQSNFSVGEAFILGCSFYIHDLAMALSITSEGRDKLQQTEIYKSTQAHLLQAKKLSPSLSDVTALKLAARELHASEAQHLIDKQVLGINRFLIESTTIRSQWGSIIGRVAASHHWNLAQVERELGVRQRIPDAIGGSVDLGFLACALRIIDYAHINFQRASALDRLLRYSIDPNSLIHWKAQEYITGPKREANALSYATIRPIEDVDAWWLFFEMATGLDKEIASVSDYLKGRSVSQGRFSLDGVKGVRNPQSFAQFIQPFSFEPVDVRFRSDAMDRLINILGGKNLYGNDHFAALREFLQNARDAILLRQIVAKANGLAIEPSEIRVEVKSDDVGGVLSVTDNGVGMNTHTITNYLLGVAADYWNSSDFFASYPSISSQGFTQTGKFGIGFLSVFMMGNRVEVETQTDKDDNLKLTLHGLGQRGALITNPRKPRQGTTVSVTFGRESLPTYEQLAEVVKAKAPMLPMPVVVSDLNKVQTIDPGWWKNTSQEEFSQFLHERKLRSVYPLRVYSELKREQKPRYYSEELELRQIHVLKKWIGKQPEIIDDKKRILAIPEASEIVVCSKGFAISSLRLKGLTGIIEIDNIEINAARNRVEDLDEDMIRNGLIKELSPSILECLDRIKNDQNIPSRYPFLVSVAKNYGIEFLLKSSIPWVNSVQPPGNCKLISTSELEAIVSDSKEVFIAYGTKANPWTVGTDCRRVFPESSTSCTLLPISEISQASVAYPILKENIERGTLADVLHYDEDRTYSNSLTQINDLHKTPLLQGTLMSIATSWNTTVDALFEQKWARHKDNIYGYLRFS